MALGDPGSELGGEESSLKGLRAVSLSDVNEISERLKTLGYRSWLVGGAVRDLLLGREPLDYDLFTTADEDRFKVAFPEAVKIKESPPTYAFPFKEPLCKAILPDPSYGDAYLLWAGRDKAALYFDLKRRDFTVNAMAIPLPLDERYPTAHLIDQSGGLDDLKKRVIRANGLAEHRFSEDPLRMVRAVRLAVDLGFSIDNATAVTIAKMAYLVAQIAASAPERLSKEICLLLTPRTGKPSEALRMLNDFRLLNSVFPSLSKLKGITQDLRHHRYDVWEHTLHVVDHVPPKLHLRLAALYHDAGKPDTRSLDEEGHIYFHGHEAEAPSKIQSDLIPRGLPQCVLHRASILCREHMFDLRMGDKAIRKLLMRLDPDLEEARRLFFDLIDLKRADLLGQGVKTEERIKLLEAFVLRAERAIEPLFQKERPFQLVFDRGSAASKVPDQAEDQA